MQAPPTPTVQGYLSNTDRVNSGPEWNINLISAPALWALSTPVNGTGVTVGVIDTGVDYFNTALETKFRGYVYSDPNNPITDYNWHVQQQGTPTPALNLTPPSSNGAIHGTFMTGIILGSQGVDQVGVAPGANWIACKLPYSFTDVDIAACMGWMRIPTTWNGTPDASKAPQIVNISAGCQCDSQPMNISILQLLQAHILPVVAAGNSGPNPVTIDSPAKSRYANSVGAVTYSTPGATPTLVTSSSRGPAPSPTSTPPGPTPVGGRLDTTTNLVKPEVAAPGGGDNATNPQYTQIRSTTVGGGYTYSLGMTSAAAAHVSGVAALLLSAYPYLTRELLEYYLVHGTINGPGHQPDNNYGFGLVNAYRSWSIVNIVGHCPGYFTDISGVPGAYFISLLSCGGVVSGYTDPNVCPPSGIPCFLPHSSITRAEFARVVDLAFGVAQYTPPSQIFYDVPPSSWAYEYINSANYAHMISGEDISTCTAYHVTYPCFLPNLAITRSQAAIIIMRARVYPVHHPSTQTYQDVSPSSISYDAIETLTYQGIINPSNQDGFCGYGFCYYNPNDSLWREYSATLTGRAVLHIAPSP